MAARFATANLANSPVECAIGSSTNGIGSGDRVGLYLHKSIDGVAAILGILQCGAAYVPVDPLAPVSRAAYILADCAVRAVIVERSFAGTPVGGVGKIRRGTTAARARFAGRRNSASRSTGRTRSCRRGCDPRGRRTRRTSPTCSTRRVPPDAPRASCCRIATHNALWIGAATCSSRRSRIASRRTRHFISTCRFSISTCRSSTAPRSSCSARAWARSQRGSRRKSPNAGSRFGTRRRRS